MNKTLGAPGLASETWENTIPRGRGTGSARPTPPSNCRHTPAQPPENTKAPETGVSGASIVCTRRASDHASSRSASSDLAASFPASSVSRLCRRWVLRVSSNPASFGVAGCKFPGFPASQLSCFASRCSLQVSLNPASSGSTGDGSSSFLESRILQRCLHRISRSPRFLDFSFALR